MNLEFQELYNNYIQENSTKKQKSEQKLHEYIYRYACFRFQADVDTASDFYVYIHEKIPFLLEGYKPEMGIPFLAFFSTNLRFYYYNFIKSRKIAGLKYVPYKFFEDTNYSVNLHHISKEEKLSKEKIKC